MSFSCFSKGLSEPFGALLALILLHPFLNPERLQYLLAGTGGLMVSGLFINMAKLASRG